jgi:hypothetical protein
MKLLPYDSGINLVQRMQSPELNLKEKIEPDYELLFDLQSDEFLTAEEREEICANTTKSRRAASLLSRLSEKPVVKISEFL